MAKWSDGDIPETDEELYSVIEGLAGRDVHPALLPLTEEQRGAVVSRVAEIQKRLTAAMASEPTPTTYAMFTEQQQRYSDLSYLLGVAKAAEAYVTRLRPEASDGGIRAALEKR